MKTTERIDYQRDIEVGRTAGAMKPWQDFRVGMIEKKSAQNDIAFTRNQRTGKYDISFVQGDNACRNIIQSCLLTHRGELKLTPRRGIPYIGEVLGGKASEMQLIDFVAQTKGIIKSCDFVERVETFDCVRLKEERGRNIFSVSTKVLTKSGSVVDVLGGRDGLLGEESAETLTRESVTSEMLNITYPSEYVDGKPKTVSVSTASETDSIDIRAIEYKRQGSEEWTQDPPTEAGTYRFRVITNEDDKHLSSTIYTSNYYFTIYESSNIGIKKIAEQDGMVQLKVNVGETKDAFVDFGDGQGVFKLDANTTLEYNYRDEGDYVLHIYGDVESFAFVQETVCVNSILRWSNTLKSAKGAFAKCLYFGKTEGEDRTVLPEWGAQLTDVSQCFEGCCWINTLNEDIPQLPESVTESTDCFKDCTSLNIEQASARKFVAYFIGEDGSILKRVDDIDLDGSTIPPDAPDVRGKTFREWEGEYEGIDSLRRIYARYDANVYTIQYNTGKGSIPSTETIPSTYTFGVGVRLPLSIREFCDFRGWLVDGEEDSVIHEIGVDEIGDRLLVASYQRQSEELNTDNSIKELARETNKMVVWLSPMSKLGEEATPIQVMAKLNEIVGVLREKGVDVTEITSLTDNNTKSDLIDVYNKICERIYA